MLDGRSQDGLIAKAPAHLNKTGSQTVDDLAPLQQGAGSDDGFGHLYRVGSYAIWGAP